MNQIKIIFVEEMKMKIQILNLKIIVLLQKQKMKKNLLKKFYLSLVYILLLKKL